MPINFYRTIIEASRHCFRVGGGQGAASPLPLRSVLLFVVGLMALHSARALDPERHLTQLSHTAWRLQDGVWDSAPRVMTQTKDGYLWVGTDAGLLRFDGVKFTRWSEIYDQQFADRSISALLGDRDGSLWVGSRTGLAHVQDGKFLPLSSNSGAVRRILQDPSGVIWLARTNMQDLKGPLCSVLADTLRCYDEKDGIPFKYGTSLVRDSSANLWMGSDALLRWRPDSSTQYLAERLKDSAIDGVHTLALAKDGSLWVGIMETGKGLGLQHLIDGHPSDVVVPGMDGRRLSVASLFVDRDDALWVGTAKDGLYRVHAGIAEHFTVTDGLSGSAISGFYQDSEGDVWVQTKAGLDRFRDFQVTTFSTREGLNSESVQAVIAANDSTIWASDGPGLDALRNGTATSILAHHGLPGKVVGSLFVDHAGLLWIGVDEGLFTYDGKKMSEVTHASTLPPCLVMHIIEDTDHTIWTLCVETQFFHLTRVRNHQLEAVPQVLNPVLGVVADPRGGVLLSFYSGDLEGVMGRFDSDRLELFPPEPGADKSWFSQLSVESDGSIWGNVFKKGLKRWKDGKSTVLGTANGLPCGLVYSWIKDDASNVWLYSNCGLLEIPRADMEKWIVDSTAQVHVNTLTALDGAYPAVAIFHPEATRSADGRLWFANSSVLQMIDPTKLSKNPDPPPVHIERLVADRKAYALGSVIELPALTRDVEIDYTALSFAIPEKVRFRYRLEGLDTEWQDAGTHRQAYYGGLGAGRYTFRVIACNNDGLWNEAGAVLRFDVKRTFYQTAWFWGLCGATGFAILYSLYLARLSQMAARIKTRLEARIEERERIARDLHDTLLQSTQGLILSFQSAAEQVPEGQPARTRMDKALDNADRVLIEGRNRIVDLRVPSASVADLPDALAEAGTQLAQGRIEQFRIVVEGRPRPLQPDARDEIYQIGREALINAFHHAGATNIRVELSYAQQELCMCVIDDGGGIEKEFLDAGSRSGHWGFQGMRERAKKCGADLDISSQSASGSEVRLRVPARNAYRGYLDSWLMKRFRKLWT